jgi:hypothetical protein
MSSEKAFFFYPRPTSKRREDWLWKDAAALKSQRCRNPFDVLYRNTEEFFGWNSQ